MSYIRQWLYAWNKPEPLRQSSLLLMLSGAVGHGDSLLETLRAHERESAGDWREKVQLFVSLLESGHSLSVAMSLVENLLPAETISAVSVAERGGCLASVLLDEAGRIGRRCAREQAGLLAPEALLLWFGGCCVVIYSLLQFLAILIAPKFKDTFEGFGLELPGISQQMLTLLQIFGKTWYLTVMPGLGLFVGLTWVAWKTAQTKLMRGYVPWARLWPRYWTPGILRILGISIAAETPISEALDATIHELPEGRAATRVIELRDRVLAGTHLLQALRQVRLLSAREYAFLSSAETSGHTDWAMRHLATAIDQRRQRRFTRFLICLGPMITLGMGAIVLFVCVAWFAPLVKLIGDLS